MICGEFVGMTEGWLANARGSVSKVVEGAADYPD